MKVATNNLGTVHTIDEQGLVERTISELIAHAANRYAVTSIGAKLFLNIRHQQ